MTRVRTLARVFLAAACGVSIAVPAPSHAADQQDLSRATLEELLGMEVDQVYSASRSIQDIRRAPASVTIITADDIRRFGYQTLEDALRSVTGFYTTSDRNYSYLGVRGFGLPGDYNSRILMLVDGFRLNDGVYNQVLIGNTFPVDIAMIERIEIVRGPSSSLYGSNAFFAVVNVMTTRGQRRPGTELAVATGSLGARRGRLAQGGRTAGGFEYLFSGTAARSDGQASLSFPAFADTQNGVASGMDGERYGNGFAKISRGGFALSAAWVSRAKRVPTAAFETVFGDPRFETTDDRVFAHAEYGRTLAPGTEIVGRLAFDAMRYRGAYPYGDPTGTWVQDDGARANGVSGELVLTRRFPRGHAATFGFEWRDDFTVDQYFTAPAGQAGLDSRQQMSALGLFAQDEFAPTPGILINAGARIDHYGSFGTTVNPRIGLILGPSRPATFKLLFGRAFRAPTAYELFYWLGQRPLAPEGSTTVEGVWEQQIGSHVRSSVSAYYNEISHLILQTVDTESASAISSIVFANMPRVYARGADASIEARWPSGVLLRGGYTYVDVDYSVTGLALSNSPWTIVKTALAIPLPRGATIAMEGEYIGARYSVERAVLPGYLRQNLAISLPRVFGGARADLRVANLFDRRYADPVGAEIRGGQVAQDGRTALVSLAYRF